MMSLKIKKFSASCSILALLVATPVPLNVWAQGDNSGQVRGGKLWGEIMGLSSSITQQMGAQQQQQQQMLQMQQMMSNLAPKNIPSKFFPQCQIPQTLPNTPQGVCEAPNGQVDQGTFNMMNNMAELGSNYVRYYDQMLTPAQNSSAPTGLRCLEDAKTAVISSMFDRQNALQVLIDKIKKETQLFRDENKKFIQKMDDLNAELHGGGTDTNENKTLSFADEFSPECRAIIGSDNLSPEQARATGLTGLVDGLREDQEKASDFRSSEANLQRSFEKAKSKLAEDLSSNGPAEILDKLRNPQAGFYDGFEGDSFGAIERTVGRKVLTMDSKKERIEGELKDLLGNDFNIPEVNSTFVEDFDRFIQGADDFYRKKFVGDCVIGRNDGFALNMDQVLGGLEQRSTNSSGTAHITYRKALENILAQDSYIEDKMSQIRELDQRFDGEITVTYRDDSANRATVTPYQLLQETVARCEQTYYQDNTYSTGGPQVAGASSQNRAVERAKNLMNEFKEEVQSFQTGLIAEIENKFQNCEGQDVTAKSCKEENVFTPSEPSFCMKAASKCSRRIQACDQRAKQLVEEKKAEIKVAAAKFNQNTQQLVSRQEQILNDVKNQVLADAEFLKSYFPGADYKFPEDLFVEMPGLELRNGEMLHGGGDIDFDDLANNVGKLKNELKNQADGIEGVLAEYIDDQKKQISENKKTWASIAEKCRGAARTMANAKAKQDNERIKNQNETNAKLGSFCQKFNSLASTENPVAGCSGPYSPEDLYEEVNEISSHLDNRVSGAIGDYMALCNQAQNEKEHGTEEEADEISLAEACEEGVYSLQNKIVSRQMDRIPSDLDSYKDEIQKYLRGEVSDLPSEVNDFNDSEDLAEELFATKSKMKLNKEDAHEELNTKLEGLDSELIKDIKSKFDDAIGDDSDHYCVTQIFKAVDGAIGSASLDAGTTNDSDKFKGFSDKLEDELEARDKSYQRASRAIASSNANLNQRWSQIGQGIQQNCAATANTSRGILGEIMSPDMGLSSDEMRNLGIMR